MAPRLYDRKFWVRMSRLHRQQHPLCEACLRRGIVTAAQVVHHIEPHHGNINVFRLSPFESLCMRCHNADEQQREKRGYIREIGEDGFPVDPMHPVHRLDRNHDDRRPANSQSKKVSPPMRLAKTPGGESKK
jgi:5-methylcytosine-specific restriction enzyme A